MYSAPLQNLDSTTPTLHTHDVVRASESQKCSCIAIWGFENEAHSSWTVSRRSASARGRRPRGLSKPRSAGAPAPRSSRTAQCEPQVGLGQGTVGAGQPGARVERLHRLPRYGLCIDPRPATWQCHVHLACTIGCYSHDCHVWSAWRMQSQITLNASGCCDCAGVTTLLRAPHL